eukprot:236306-Rhodomonas_salina.2
MFQSRPVRTCRVQYTLELPAQFFSSNEYKAQNFGSGPFPHHWASRVCGCNHFSVLGGLDLPRCGSSRCMEPNMGAQLVSSPTCCSGGP